MILFSISIVVFNFVVYAMKKRLSKIQILLIWEFSMILEILFDIYIDEKTHGYWYFTPGIDLTNILGYLFLIPPICVAFLNWYPLNNYTWFSRIGYIFVWLVFLISYELLARSPQPWGYFYYGWWTIFYSIVLDPILLAILILYYKVISKIERMEGTSPHS